MELIITDKAMDDLKGIHDYIRDNFYSLQSAEKTVSELFEAAEKLVEIPYLGLDAEIRFGRSFLKDDKVRLLIAGKHLIWYIISNNQIVVLRVANQRQDIAKLILK